MFSSLKQKAFNWCVKLNIPESAEAFYEVLLLFRGKAYCRQGINFLDELYRYGSRYNYSEVSYETFVSLLQEKSEYIFPDDDLLLEAAYFINRYNITCKTFKYMLFKLGRYLKGRLLTYKFYKKLYIDECSLYDINEDEISYSFIEDDISLSDGFKFLLFDKGNLKFTKSLFNRYWLYLHGMLGLGGPLIDKLILIDERNVKRWLYRMNNSIKNSLQEEENTYVN